jgi:prophage tail gpP-like protein
MVKPVIVFIDGEELIGYTDLSLSRSKDKMTGELNLTLFMNYIPSAPTIVDCCRGKEINVYIGGHLAFTGSIDKRTGTGANNGADTTGSGESAYVGKGKHRHKRIRHHRHHRHKKGGGGDGGTEGGKISLSIGPNEYSVKLTARGKTKYLIDSSHQHPTTNMMQPTSKEVVNKLVKPWNVEVEWMGTEVKLDKVRFRDGCRVVDELHRVCSENCYYMYETRDGKLRVTDDTGKTEGEPIVLGVNILSFSAEQSEDQAKSKIKVKGQRTKKDVWGKDAVVDTVKEVEDQWVGTNIPITVQHYGDATPEALERRAQFEANKRSSASKQVKLDVFHVQSTSGEPWDIGQLHYVEIPPEGIFDIFECTDLTYTVSGSELKTSLTLSPPPAKGTSGSSKSGVTGSLPEMSNQYAGIGNSRRIAAGITFAPGSYPSPWSGPTLSVLPFVAVAEAVIKSNMQSDSLLNDLADNIGKKMPLKLPANFRSRGE